MKRIGIFAGVFDPIHLGHTDFIKRTIAKEKLNKVLVMVEQQPKYKDCLASFKHRRAMTSLAISDMPEAEVYDSASKFFPITSSLPKIREKYPGVELFLLVGDDVAQHIYDWPDAKNILDNVGLIVAKRGHKDAYSQASSLKIRTQLAKTKDSKQLDAKVLNYCRQNKLYLTTGA